jgi:hypothetical protein
LDTAPFRAASVENAAECGDLDRQIGILDHRPPPDGRHDLFFCDEFARPLDQHAQNIEGAGAYGYGDEDTAFIASAKTIALSVEAKLLELENVGCGAHAPLSPSFPRIGIPIMKAMGRPRLTGHILRRRRGLEKTFVIFL